MRSRRAICGDLAIAALMSAGCATTGRTESARGDPHVSRDLRQSTAVANARSGNTPAAPPQVTSQDAAPNLASSIDPAAAATRFTEREVLPIALEQPLEVLSSIEAGTPTPPTPQTTLIPIEFGEALTIATGQNPQVAFAHQRINEAFAQARAAEVLWVPSLRAGMNYNKHEGTIQDVAGNIIETSRGSVYTGLGAQAVGAGSQASRATSNDILMETALAYNDLLEALEVEAIAAETRDNTRRLAEVTGEYARTGQGLPSDADRAQAELALREVEARRALENVEVATVRLARLLSQDPTLKLAPREPAIVPISLAPTHC
jgi:outer membrane protein TolC